MTSITKQVWQLLDEDPSLQKDLGRGVINVSGLAAYLQEHAAIGGSLDSVISAIRRYKANPDVTLKHESLQQAFGEAIVSTKTRITGILLSNSSNLYKILAGLMRDPSFHKSELFRLIKSREETLLMVDSESLADVRKVFPEGNIVEIQEGLAELSVILTPAGWRSKGVLARLSNEIANYGVNIIALITTEPRVSVFVTEDELMKAHEAVLSLTRT